MRDRGLFFGGFHFSCYTFFPDKNNFTFQDEEMTDAPGEVPTVLPDDVAQDGFTLFRFYFFGQNERSFQEVKFRNTNGLHLTQACGFSFLADFLMFFFGQRSPHQKSLLWIRKLYPRRSFFVSET